MSGGSGKKSTHASRMEPTPEMVAGVAAATHRKLSAIIENKGDFDYRISKRRVRDLSFYFLRDILRIADRQSDEISATKFAGYWAFWIRKVKPILFCNSKTDAKHGEALEITEVNERVCFELALSFLQSQGRGDGDLLHDGIRSSCAKPCDGSICFKRYTSDFFGPQSKSISDYVIYSMAYRTFGPHHMTMILDQLILGSCRSAN
jgi:hypothetical protein